MDTNRKQLTTGKKIGYGIASAGDALTYGVMTVYLLYYLTTVAHIDAGKAGTISSVALFISAVTTFFVGYLSDNSRAKSGRRRPYIKAAMPVMFISFIGLFSYWGLEGSSAVIYYGVFASLLWISYCTFFVPYTALGAEITDDYAERTSIRAYAAVGTQVGNFSSSVLPLIVVGLFAGAGLSATGSWTATAALFITAAVVCIGIMVRATKGQEMIITHEDGEKKAGLFTAYLDVLKAKPMKYLILAIIAFSIVNSIFASNCTYFVIFKLGLPEEYVSTIFAVIFLVAIPLTPFINAAAQKMDKRKAFILFFCLSAALFIVFRIVGVNSIIVLGFLAVAFAFANASYWQLISATLYDVAEVIEIKTGKRAEGTISSLQSICQQIGSSLAMLGMGWLLEINGFDGSAASQSADTLDTIMSLQTVIPSIGLLFGAFMIFLFPITRKKYALIQAALREKKETGKYSREGLERIL